MNSLGVRIGYAAGTGIASVGQLREIARWAGSAGFDGLWVSQAFGVDPLVALAAVAGETAGLGELGTSVVPLVGRHPISLAAEVRTAQSALDGRLTLGLGASHAVVAEGVFGQSYEKAYSLTEEFLRALVPLLDGGAADVEGEQVRAHGGLSIDAAACPVLLAALGPRMLELAGRVTSGTTLGQCGPKTIANRIAPVITRAAELAGRPAPRIMALVTVVVTDDPEGARARAIDANRGYAALPSYRRVLDLEGVSSGAELLLAGSVERIAEGLGTYVAAGVTDLRIGMGTAEPDEIAATREGLATLLSS